MPLTWSIIAPFKLTVISAKINHVYSLTQYYKRTYFKTAFLITEYCKNRKILKFLAFNGNKLK